MTKTGIKSKSKIKMKAMMSMKGYKSKLNKVLKKNGLEGFHKKEAKQR